MFGDIGTLRTDCGFVTADRIAADELDALTGAALFGCLDWREDREPVSPLQGDPPGPDQWDAQAMGDNDDIEAEARALAAKKAREREVEKRAEEILAAEAKAGERQRQADIKAEIAANKAKNRTINTIGAIVLALGGIAAIVALAVAKENRDHLIDSDAEVFLRQFQDLSDAACKCRDNDCRSKLGAEIDVWFRSKDGLFLEADQMKRKDDILLRTVVCLQPE